MSRGGALSHGVTWYDVMDNRTTTDNRHKNMMFSENATKPTISITVTYPKVYARLYGGSRV